MREVDEGELQVTPSWKQAVLDFFDEGFKSGDIVLHAWLEDHLGIAALPPGARLSVDDFKARQLKWLASVDAFRAELLEGHQIMLASVFGKGYRVTPPAEQTAITSEQFEAEVKRTFRKAAVRLQNVRVNELTDAQRRENVDAITKLAMLRGMEKKLE